MCVCEIRVVPVGKRTFKNTLLEDLKTQDTVQAKKKIKSNKNLNDDDIPAPRSMQPCKANSDRWLNGLVKTPMVSVATLY